MKNAGVTPKKEDMKLSRLLIAGLWLLVFCFPTPALAKEKEKPGAVKWFKFDEENALKEWTEKIFRGRVFYSLEHAKEDGFVHALSQDAASGLYYKMRFSPSKLPMISWKWKVRKFPEVSANEPNKDVSRMDDFAARIYLVFPSGSFGSSRCLEYIWDERLPRETIVDSPWGKNIKLIVVRTGADRDMWYKEERNIYEDFKKAFGYYTKLDVGAVAFMTDTDDTRDTAEAYYDEIKLGYK